MLNPTSGQGTQPANGIQLGSDGPVLPLPAGWSVIANQNLPGTVWAVHPAAPQFFLGCIACSDSESLSERSAYNLNAMTDARVVAINTSDETEWRVTYHCINGSQSSVYIEEFVRCSTPVLLCASIASVAYPQHHDVIAEFFRGGRRAVVAHALGTNSAAR